MILAVDYHDKNNLLKFADSKWIYIGGSTGQEHIKNTLKETNRIFIGKDIEETVDLVRDNFVDHIGKVSQQQTNRVLWYSSRMASKSSQTTMFNQYVYLKVLEKFIEDGNENILIVSDDEELFYNLSKIFAGKIKIFKKKILNIDQIYKKRAGYAKNIRYCLFWSLSRFFKNKKLDSFDVFLHGWIDRRVFQKLPNYNDSYFRDLENILKKKGYCVARLTPVRVSLRNIFKLNRYFNNMVYPLAYVPWGVFFKCVFTEFKVTVNSQKFTSIDDIEILSSLLENEIYKENNTKIFLEYLLFFYGYKNIALKIKPNSTLFYLFENQPWEKMFNLAFEKFNRIAYQHSTIPYNWLDFRISEYENPQVLPTTILTSGKKWSSFLKDYYQNSIIEDAGAIRFSYLFKEGLQNEVNNQAKNIVVALDEVLTISIPLQKLLLAFLKSNNLSDYSIKIKPHPYLPKYACLQRSFAAYKNCKFTSDDMGELLKDCSLLVTSNSSVVFESVFSEIKTLYFIPEEPAMGLEYYLRESLFIAYSDDFSEKFQEALESCHYPKENIEEYFSKPDYSVFLKYIKQEHFINAKLEGRLNEIL